MSQVRRKIILGLPSTQPISCNAVAKGVEPVDQGYTAARFWEIREGETGQDGHAEALGHHDSTTPSSAT